MVLLKSLDFNSTNQQPQICQNYGTSHYMHVWLIFLVIELLPGTDANRVDLQFVPVDVVDLLEYVVHVPHLHRPVYR